MKEPEIIEKLLDFIVKNWHCCPFDENANIDFEKECVGFSQKGCKECIIRNIDKLGHRHNERM